MENSKYWVIEEYNSWTSYYYMGYYKDGLPCFNMALADAIHFASFKNAQQIHKVLNEVIPCRIIEFKFLTD
jgi:hypothetical protein